MSALEIFFSYSHKDEVLREELEKQLSLLKWQGLINGWHDRRILAGQEWEDEIDKRLNSVDIILLLISPDFMASNYCFGVEVERAMERHKAGEAQVIPIILRPVDWHTAPFGKLQALPKDGQPITSWSNRDKAFLDIARGIRRAIEEVNIPRQIPKNDVQQLHTNQSPYRGLFAFSEEDEPYFYGREAFTEQLVDAVYKRPLVTVIGPSGSGKSSVVFAGLIPQLRKEGSWLITSLRPGSRPFRSLAIGLMPLLEPNMSERARLIESNELAQHLQQGKIALQDVVEHIMQKHGDRRFLLVIDQFEELYTLCREPSVCKDFLDALISITQAASEFDFLNFNLVLTLRADFLGQALTYRPFADSLQFANLFLGPMTTQELQDTIRKPAEKLNVEIEDGLTERIINEVKQGTNRLPLLEFALTLLWDKKKGSNKLTHTGYQEIGGVEKALTDHAEKIFAGLSEAEQKRVQQVLIQLVRFGEGTEDIRRLATRAEIGEENWKLVLRLSGAGTRLVISGRDQTTGEETVEVVHEALIRGWPRLGRWMEDNREFRTWQERLRTALRLWEKNNKDDGALLHGALLVEAERWMANRPKDISKPEKEFVDLSQQYQKKEAQRWKNLYEESQRFALLYQSEQELSQITELSELEQAYDVTLRIAERYCQSQVVIRRYDEFDESLVLVRGTQFQDSTPTTLARLVRIDEGVNGQVARERRSIMINDIGNPPPDVISLKLSDPSIHSMVIVPIIFKERYYGNLGISYKDVFHYQDTDRKFYEALAQQLASTIYRLELVQASLEFEKRAISAEEMSSIGEVAFVITHRLSNDLGLVEFYAKDIEMELKTQAIANTHVTEKLEDIVRSVRSVLTFSQALKNELAKTGVSEAMGSEAILISPRVLLEQVLIDTSLPPNISISLKTDEYVADVRVVPKLVADILHNLVLNAIEAMPEGGNITLKAHNAGRFVELEVHDTGMGIPPKHLSRIFDLFFSTKGSSGFGLWSARRNALRNHGDIRVASQPGQGTTFTLLLPQING